MAHWTRVGCVFLLLCAGCGSKHYPMRGLPFCSSDAAGEGSRLAKPTFFFARAGEERHVKDLFQNVGGPDPAPIFTRERVLAAVVECAEKPQQILGEWAEELTEERVPEICASQRVVFHGWLEAQQTERSKALGYGGELRLPELDLGCTHGGTLVQDDDSTLAQKLRRFKESVERFDVRHERLPRSWDELAEQTRAEPLPDDPWGTPLRFSAAESQVKLDSAGPDATFDTKDDIAVVEQQRGGSTSIVAFPGVAYHPDEDYDAFLQRAGP